MYSIVLPDKIDPSIQAVLWTLLVVFFVMVTLGWWTAARNWFNDEEPKEEPNSQGNEGENQG